MDDNDEIQREKVDINAFDPSKFGRSTPPLNAEERSSSSGTLLPEGKGGMASLLDAVKVGMAATNKAFGRPKLAPKPVKKAAPLQKRIVEDTEVSEGGVRVGDIVKHASHHFLAEVTDLVADGFQVSCSGVGLIEVTGKETRNYEVIAHKS